MAKVDVLNWEKEKVGEVELNPAAFETEVNEAVLHSVVRWQLACRRRGTHKAKVKGEVAGSGKKPFKQKGTGNARQGMVRSPLFPGGGVTFAPSPRDYSYTLPKKVKQLGLRSALSQLNQEGKVFVVESLKAQGKTKELSAKLKKFGLDKAVLMDGEADAMVVRASKNLQNYRYYGVNGLNVYDLLKYGTLVVTKESLTKIVERCGV
ncbi:MAG: 50S ribosomal protein L4 [Bdellovibrionales bacterium]|nr:50S ribosomal protein L4 [Bdellovibrionales bacterium]